MEAKTNYTMVGLAVLILAGALVAAGLWLSVGFNQKKYYTYAVFMREAVSGLSEQSPVKYNGVKVGFVSKIELNRQDPRQVEILLNIEEGTPITVSTMATLISQGITGNTYVGLSATSSDLTPLRAAPNQPYPIIPAKPSLFNQLDKVLKEVSVNVNKVSLKISQVFSKENVDNLHRTLANIRSFTDVLAKNGSSINHSIKSAEIFLHNSADVSDDFPEIVTDLKSGLKKFSKMATSLATAGDKVSTTMESGKTAIDKISQQTVPPVITLVRRLDVIAANLEKISKQMRQNPAVIIRGTTPPRPGPGE
ncbi:MULTISPECIES: MlaD family protein [Legionella]|uniref:ABC transport system periplasmic substrate binding protein n=1 Tax=Legionella maceachernii TaxID=466 RepID=A0A0W0VZ81_9GAMM|nr:MlaD family protein [Legionella maceachernii]KTD25604.1 ABC transport system periplasmic substrate binding protein [Legionella maceachernii]SJZ57238.1 phospholipid/cholesterol/gamma-HCH transport system substrate-binding protein [Legionella maceachernii]SUP00586.1 virulence factor Mce family protein [Legionella maceachernii]